MLAPAPPPTPNTHAPPGSASTAASPQLPPLPVKSQTLTNPHFTHSHQPSCCPWPRLAQAAVRALAPAVPSLDPSPHRHPLSTPSPPPRSPPRLHCLHRGWPAFLLKGRMVHSFSSVGQTVSPATTPLESSHRCHGRERVWLCLNKTLFKNTGDSEPGLARGWSKRITPTAL